MLEDLLHYFGVLYHTDYFHLSGAFWTGKGIYLVNFLDKTSPISLVLIGGFLRFKYGEYQVVMILFFPLTAADITIEAVISYHLFSLVWHMRTHGSEPFEDVEDLLLFPILGLIDGGTRGTKAAISF